jgi:diguanylate cyclase (GGDEF)-like protein
MDRRISYALTAGVLSSGAPAGLLGIRLAQAEADPISLRDVRDEIVTDRAAYVYVGVATAAIFALFGYILGRQADRLAELSETDPLTHLYNTRGFSARLNVELKRFRRTQDSLSLLFLDLDGLKVINDRFGHRAGSETLRRVGSFIRSELRETDVASRWGGDEFTILAPNTPLEAGVALAERIRSRIAANATGWPLTASIGVASVAAGDATLLNASELMRAADTAMYQAKRRGKNAVVPWPGLSRTATATSVT